MIRLGVNIDHVATVRQARRAKEPDPVAAAVLATLGGAERVRLFRLVWDTCISAFSGRQALYEYYFFGDPVRMAGPYVASYDREPCKAAVRAFLERG